MAGFLKAMGYFLPRAKIKLQYPMKFYEEQLLPDLPTWRRQIKLRYGDKSRCANKFLNELIPFFIEVVIQDGIYFVRDFPQHEFSRLLCVRMDPD